MKHPAEEELIAYRDDDSNGREETARHIAECPTCRSTLERIESILAAFTNLPVPDPGEDYGQRVWQQIAPRLPNRRARDWSEWFATRPLAAAGAVAVMIVAAFLAGRFLRPSAPGPREAGAAVVRERVLLVAVGGHLDRSEMVLIELSNAGPDTASKKLINISAERQRAADLLEENRLYRQTAQEQGDAALASVLDDLERVLLDVAHSPQEVTPAQFEAIRRRIETRGIVFKVRVVSKDLRQRQQDTMSAPAKEQSEKKERNKV